MRQHEGYRSTVGNGTELGCLLQDILYVARRAPRKQEQSDYCVPRGVWVLPVTVGACKESAILSLRHMQRAPSWKIQRLQRVEL